VRRFPAPRSLRPKVTLEEDGVVSEREFVLEAERRVSLIQHLFKPFRKDTRTLGAILASEYERGGHSE
jgi:hypothetical protein